ncbi:hypothetical protein [Croceicoccus mobilis]|uniref:Uncharacterized protein n=1 Tax=Croceicoccus mobilis TaxID=1703339 RepID=A0A916Z679_9SPHN|nr:hypothetical protein [Croceicoccus mobilis]GGD78508.1 hypothetical protein GCM10010990_30450 [Croceicoccus mobilis]
MDNMTPSQAEEKAATHGNVTSREGRLPQPKGWCAGGYLGIAVTGPRSDMAHGGWARNGERNAAKRPAKDKKRDERH